MAPSPYSHGPIDPPCMGALWTGTPMKVEIPLKRVPCGQGSILYGCIMDRNPPLSP